MYTLKIYWTRVDENDIQADETTLFIPADEIRVHGQVIEIDGETPGMKHWQAADWHDYRHVTDGNLNARGPVHSLGRLICVKRDGFESYYVASRAWLLGPSGGTIERVAP